MFRTAGFLFIYFSHISRMRLENSLNFFSGGTEPQNKAAQKLVKGISYQPLIESHLNFCGMVFDYVQKFMMF